MFVDGVKGMRVHARINVRNERGQLIVIGAFFYWKNGGPLRDANGLYRSTDGNAAVFDRQSPPWHNTDYNTFSVFMPYTELHLTQSSADLQARLAVHDEARNVFLVVSEPVDFYFSQ